MPAERIVFQTNVPVELALRFVVGKAVESKFGTGMQHMFSTTDDRVFYVAEAAGTAIAAQLAELGTQPGEFVTICKAEQEVGRGRRQIRWVVAPVSDAAEPLPVKRMPPQSVVSTPQVGERSDGTYAVPALRSAPKVMNPHPELSDSPQWTRVLLAHTNAMVDVYSKAVAYAAENHAGVVKHETIQSLLVTAFIQLSKAGGR